MVAGVGDQLGVLDDIRAVVEALGAQLSEGRADLERIARNSIEIAWISDDEKDELLARVDRFVSEN